MFGTWRLWYDVRVVWYVAPLVRGLVAAAFVVSCPNLPWQAAARCVRGHTLGAALTALASAISLHMVDYMSHDANLDMGALHGRTAPHHLPMDPPTRGTATVIPPVPMAG